MVHCPTTLLLYTSPFHLSHTITFNLKLFSFSYFWRTMITCDHLCLKTVDISVLQWKIYGSRKWLLSTPRCFGPYLFVFELTRYPDTCLQISIQFGRRYLMKKRFDFLFYIWIDSFSRKEKKFQNISYDYKTGNCCHQDAWQYIHMSHCTGIAQSSL